MGPHTRSRGIPCPRRRSNQRTDALDYAALLHQISTLSVTDAGPSVPYCGPPPRLLGLSRTEFERRRQELSEAFVRQLDSRVCNGEVSAYYLRLGGIKVDWVREVQTQSIAGAAHAATGTIMLSKTILTSEGSRR